MRRPRVLAFGAIALFCLAGAGAYVLLGLGGGTPALQDRPLAALSPEGVLRFRVGDLLRYDLEGGGQHLELDVEILAPTRLTAPSLERADALPILVSPRGGGPDAPRDAYVADLSAGGLLGRLDACLLDDRYVCARGKTDVASTSWQHCPFFSMFAPIDAIPREALFQSAFTLQDPLKGTEYRFQVERNADRATILLQSDPAPRLTCRLAFERFVVDLDEGILLEATGSADAFRFTGRTRGTGAEVVLGGGLARPHRLVEPVPRTTPYPPGLGGSGPTDWTLDQAWTAAVAGSQDLRAWLASNPGAFLYGLINTTSSASVAPGVLGGVEDRTDQWDIRILSPERKLIKLLATQRSVQHVPQREFSVETMPVPAEVPARFHPPALAVVDTLSFGSALRAHGFSSAPGYDRPDVSVLFDGDDADWLYTQFTAALSQGAAAGISSSVATEYVILNGDTGRLTDALVDRDALERLYRPGE